MSRHCGSYWHQGFLLDLVSQIAFFFGKSNGASACQPLTILSPECAALIALALALEQAYLRHSLNLQTLLNIGRIAWLLCCFLSGGSNQAPLAFVVDFISNRADTCELIPQ